MKQSAYLINCARGDVVDEEALVEVLREKRIAGAALDCLTIEPPEQDNPLLEMDNVILTPHMAAHSQTALAYLKDKTVTQVADVLRGRTPEFVRNPEVFRRIRIHQAAVARQEPALHKRISERKKTPSS